jgi:hypothetical protein
LPPSSIININTGLGKSNSVSSREWFTVAIKPMAVRRPLSFHETVDSIAIHTGTLFEIMNYNVETSLLPFYQGRVPEDNAITN